MGEIHLKWCIIYSDDIIIFSKTPKEHLQRLHGIFGKLAAAGLKLKPSKCKFFKTLISHLRHIISARAIQTDHKKVEAICNWPKPSTVIEVHSFPSFTSHYHHSINKYAHLVRPLNKLTVWDNSHKKKSAVKWNNDCEQAFQILKQLCCETPVLAYADYSKPFKLHNDAGELGLGGVLYQSQEEGPDHVTTYASRALSNTESR